MFGRGANEKEREVEVEDNDIERHRERERKRFEIAYVHHKPYSKRKIMKQGEQTISMNKDEMNKFSFVFIFLETKF